MDMSRSCNLARLQRQAPVQVQSNIVLLPQARHKDQFYSTLKESHWSASGSALFIHGRIPAVLCAEGMVAKLENREAAKNLFVVQPI
jgi:hypothetical protein